MNDLLVFLLCLLVSMGIIGAILGIKAVGVFILFFMGCSLFMLAAAAFMSRADKRDLL